METTNRRTAVAGLAASLAAACQRGTVKTIPFSDANFPSVEGVLQILRERIDVQHQSRGIVVGLVGLSSKRWTAYGALGANDSRAVDSNTVFPIASITKLFTALLLADAVVRGEVALADPVSRYLPNLKVSRVGDREITLFDLATHTAGFPSYPADYPPETETAARAKYGRDRLYAALAAQKPNSSPGMQWSYSDIGPQLVADALARHTQLRFEDLLKRRVTRPLGMESTAFVSTPSMSKHLASDHDVRLRVIEPERAPSMAASGDLYSTVADMMKLIEAFLAASMGDSHSPLSRAMEVMINSRRIAMSQGGEQGVGVQVWRLGGSEVFGHNGNKPGSASALLWSPKRLGAVVLSNAAPPVDDIARHILEPRSPLAKPMITIDVDSSTLRQYVGRFKERTLGVIFVVTLENDELRFEPVGQAPKVAMSPEGPDAFTIPRLRARVAFRSKDVVWVNFLGREYLADRVE